MPAIEPLCQSVGIDANQLSRVELCVLEAELQVCVYEELKEIHRASHKAYFRLMKLNIEMENKMLEEGFLKHVIIDIIQSGEYSIGGIAYYTQSSQEVISDIASGRIVDPSLPLSQKIINLHRSVRPDLYRKIIQKILERNLQVLP